MTDHAKYLVDGLLPCPFCGAPADQPEFYGESKTARFIDCGKCGASVYRAHPGENDAILIAAWNARPQASGDLVERLRTEADQAERQYNHGQEGHDTDFRLLREAADALSRSPQPDSVTEDRVEAAAKAIRDLVAPGHPLNEMDRACARAALAAKGKP